MHMPDGMITGAVCPLTLALGTGAVALSAYAASKSINKPSAMKFAAVASAIFVLQMLNFPISQGTSGHFLGAAFAAWALGTAPGILAMTLLIAVQALFFGDGGVSAMGANLLCMAVIGAGISGLTINSIKKAQRNIPDTVSLGIAAFLSIVTAAAACSFLLWISGNAPFKTLMSSMILTHMKIGVAETGITLAIMGLAVSVSKSSKSVAFKTGAVSLMLGAGSALSIFASELPDGLEYNAEKLGFINNAMAYFQGLMPDYVFPGVASAVSGKILAGIAGIIIVAAVSCFLKPVYIKPADR